MIDELRELLVNLLDPEKHSAFAWIQQVELDRKVESAPMKKACERAFGLLARSRKNK